MFKIQLQIVCALKVIHKKTILKKNYIAQSNKELKYNCKNDSLEDNKKFKNKGK